MEINLKYRIELLSRFYIFQFTFLALQLGCMTTENQKVNITQTSNAMVLRITYDSTWTPKTKFTVRDSGNLFGSGNSYLIDYLDEQNDFTWLKISATDQENKHGFKYLLNELDRELLKVFYFPWNNSRVSILLKPTSASENRIQCRWEGIYKGYLIIIESEFYNKDRLNYNQIASKFQNHILDSLSLY